MAPIHTPSLTSFSSLTLAVIIACGFWFGLDGDNAAVAGFIALIVNSLLGVAVTTYFLSKKMQESPGKWTWRQIWWEVSFSNIFKLKALVEPTIQYIPDLWAYLIKGLIPHLLIVLFVSAAVTNNTDGDPNFGNYGGYPTKPYQVLGILTFVFAAFLFVIGFIFPQVYAPLATPFTDENDDAKVKELGESEEDADEENDDTKAKELENSGEELVEDTNEEEVAVEAGEKED